MNEDTYNNLDETQSLWAGLDPVALGLRRATEASAFEYRRRSALPDDLAAGHTLRSIQPMRLRGREPYAHLPKLNFAYYYDNTDTGKPVVDDCFSFPGFACRFEHDDRPLTAALTFDIKQVERGLAHVVEQDILGPASSDDLQEGWFPAMRVDVTGDGADLLQFAGLCVPVWYGPDSELYHGNRILAAPAHCLKFNANDFYSVRLSYFVEEVAWEWHC